MAKLKAEKKTDATTEDRIKSAARIVFHKKGFAATRTRDIAEAAGINLALLNYYFRSKQKLFDMIMIETLSGFIQHILVVLNNEKTTLNEKIEIVAESYINLILAEPEIPAFILTEIRYHPRFMAEKIPVKQIINQSVFFKQHQQAVNDGIIKEANPLHFLMNLMGLIVFPFIAKPLLMGAGGIEEGFKQLMEDRKKLIPVWIKALMEAG